MAKIVQCRGNKARPDSKEFVVTVGASAGFISRVTLWCEIDAEYMNILIVALPRVQPGRSPGEIARVLLWG